MDRHREIVALGIALLLAALASPVEAFRCNGCPCPMTMAVGGASSCCPSVTVEPTVTCCSRLPAAQVSSAPAVVAAPEVAAPEPVRNPVAAAPIYTFEQRRPAPAEQQRARAERRHERGLCILNSVFLN